MKKNKIAIIGSGYCGLGAATKLIDNGYEVSIFESSKIPGGLASGMKKSNYDWPIESFYHHWFNNEPGVMQIAKKFNLQDDVTIYSPETSFYKNGKIKPFDRPYHILTFPELTIYDRWRLGTSLAKLKLMNSWEQFDNVTAESWIIKNMGENVYFKLWRPMLIGKWGEYHEKINMAWFWARIHVRTRKLMYPIGGFQTFTEKIVEGLKKRNAKFFFSFKVEKIFKNDKTGRFRINDISDLDYDKVLFTNSPNKYINSFDNFLESYKAHLNNYNQMGAVCMMIRLKRKVLKNSYWINIPADSQNIFENNIPFLVCVEHTNMISNKYYNNEHIVYCANYLKPGHKLFDYSKEQLFGIYFDGLKKLNPKIQRNHIIEFELAKTNYASPVFNVNHRDLIPSFDSTIPGLYWASMSHVYPWDRGTNYALEVGSKVADHIIYEQRNKKQSL